VLFASQVTKSLMQQQAAHLAAHRIEEPRTTHDGYVDTGQNRRDGVFGFISASTKASTQRHVDDQLRDMTVTYVFGMAMEGGSRMDASTAFARRTAEAYVGDTSPVKRRFGRIPLSAHREKQQEVLVAFFSSPKAELAPSTEGPQTAALPALFEQEKQNVAVSKVEPAAAPSETMTEATPSGPMPRSPPASLRRQRQRGLLRARAGGRL